ncbi:MAG: galactokinase, partial [Desulfosarcinaceae bacterium]
MISLHKILDRQGPVQASAPCRVDMGGTLDLSTFYLPLQHLKPCTFNIALDLRTTVTLSAFDRGKIKISSKGFEDFVAESQTAPFRHPLGLMLAVAAHFNADGVHLQIASSSPPRSALGGSSVAAVALIWAFFKALHTQGRSMPAPAGAASLAHAIEQSVAGVPCGQQDQLAAVFGGVNAWHWKAGPGKQGYRRESLVAPERMGAFSRQVVVAYCGRPHASKDVNGTWVSQFLAGRHRTVWRDIVDVCRRFCRAVSREDISLAQEMMNRETDLRLGMTPEVLDETGRALVDEARRLGCGARFTG